MLIQEIKTKKDLKEFFIDYLNKKSERSLHISIQNSKTLQDLIIKFTPNENDLSLSARRQLIIMDIERPKCVVCGNKTQFERTERRFLECCSVKCAANNEERKKKIENTCVDRYGATNIRKSEKFKNYMVQHNLDKYGVEWYIQSNKFKEKSEKTSIEKYGTKKPCQSPEIIKKLKISLNNRSKDDIKKSNNKRINTCIKNYGVDHHMKNIHIFEKQQKKSFYMKEYTLPSGRIIKIQGFENRCLDELLKTYNECDILVSTSEIFREIGPIDYVLDGKSRRYFPDFYIQKENKIIEVKSTRTFAVNKKMNLEKQKRCLELGFKFEFWIYGPEGLAIL